MARRGHYAKGKAKRDEILAVALDVIAHEGYDGTTVQRLADAVSLSKTALLHYFGNKETLLREVLRRRDDVRAAFDPTTEDFRAAVVRDAVENAQVPGLAQLFSRLSAEATVTDHPAHEYFSERYREARSNSAENFRTLLDAEARPGPENPEMAAIVLIALLDGLQLQQQYDPDVDVTGALSYLWELMAGR